MDIQFVTHRFCIMKLSDGKEYNCIKFDNFEHCEHVLTKVGLVTDALYDKLYRYALKNAEVYEKNEMVFMLDDDAPEQVLLLPKDADITSLNSMKNFCFSEKTKEVMKFVMTRFYSSSADETSKQQALKDEESRDVSMEDVENKSKGQNAIAPAFTSMAGAQASVLNCSTRATKEKATVHQSSNALAVYHPEEGDFTSSGDQKQPADMSIGVSESNTGDEVATVNQSSKALTVYQAEEAEFNPCDDEKQSDDMSIEISESRMENNAAGMGIETETEVASATRSVKKNKKGRRKSSPSNLGAQQAADENAKKCNALDDDEGLAKVAEYETPTNQDKFNKGASRSLRANNDVDTSKVEKSTKASTKTARKQSPPPGKEQWTVALTFDDMKTALETAGFKFTTGCFALPNRHPADYNDAKLGKDFFDTEYEFRKHLCEFGLADCEKWDSQTRDNLCIWVRYHIVNYDKMLPDIGSSKTHNVWKDLQRIGFRYANTWHGPAYCFPGDGGVEFPSEKDCLIHISRHGFPGNCDFSSMTDFERLRFQMVVAEAQHVNALDPIEVDLKQSDDSLRVRSSTLRKREQVSDSSPSNCISTVTKKLDYNGTSKRAKRLETPQPVTFATPPRPMQTGDNFPSQLPGKSPSPTQTGDNLPSQLSQTSRPTQISLSPETSNHLSTTITLSPAASTIFPEFHGTDRERLHACFNALKLNHSIELMRFDSDDSSSLRANLARVDTFLASALKRANQDWHDDDDDEEVASAPSALYCCGEPGVGKTCGVMFCCNRLRDEGKTTEFDIIVAKFNGNDLKDTKALHEELGIVLKTKATQKAIVSKLKGKNCSKKDMPPFLVVVLDEIDMMLSKNASIHRKSEQVIKEMLEYTSDPDIRFALIGISNSSGNHKYGRLHQLGKFQEVITFKPYSASDLQRILEVRVGHSLIPENVIEVIAKKVGTSSGDARKALDVAARAVAKCIDQTKEGVTSSVPLVKIQHALQAYKLFETDYKGIIEKLPMTSKVVLCVASVTAKTNESITLKRLQHLVTETLRETGRMDDMIPSRDFIGVVETLIDSGLMKSSVQRNEKGGFEIEVEIPVGDVEDVLVAELTTPFYATLRERAALKMK